MSMGFSRIAERISQAVAAQKLAGAVVAITDRGQIQRLEEFGEYRTYNIFQIASSSKPIAATTIFLNGPLDERQKLLLAHSAGIFGNDTKDPVERDLLRNAGRTLAEAAAEIAKRPLIYPPGEGTKYSDAGFLLAGRAAEVAAGADFETVMRNLLLDPLGMADTFYRTDRDVANRLAPSYERAGGRLRRAPLQHRLKHDGLIRVGGGLFSTAADLAAFLRFHLNLTNSERLAEMYRDHTRGRWHKDPMGGTNDGYGLGWQLGGGAFFHAGAFGSLIWAHPGRGIGVVLLTQMPIIQVYPLWREIIEDLS